MAEKDVGEEVGRIVEWGGGKKKIIEQKKKKINKRDSYKNCDDIKFIDL